MSTKRDRCVSMAAAGVLLVCASAFAQPSLLGQVAAEEADSVASLRRKVSLLNLVNGLYLSEEQLAQLLDVARQASTSSERMTKSWSYAQQNLHSCLKELNEVLTAGENIPEDLKRRTHRAEAKLKVIGQSYLKAATGFQERAERVFTENQLDIVADFAPCLIPPEDFANPTRTGQADDTSRIEELIEELREMPTRLFERRKYMIANRHLRRLELHLGRMSDDEMRNERQRFLAFLAKARAMNDVDFAMNSEQLAAEFKPNNDLAELRQQLDRVRQQRRGLSKLGRFFLCKEAVPVLESRLRAAKEYTPSKKVDLARIKGADADCKDGVCALK